MIGEPNNNSTETSKVIDNIPSQISSEIGYSEEVSNASNSPEDQFVNGSSAVEEFGSEPNPSDDAGVEDVTTPNPPLDVVATDEANYKVAIQRLEEQVLALKTELDERLSLYARLQADFDNFRKRTQKEKEELDIQVKRSTIIELLPVVDNFDRARSQIKPQTEEGNNVHKSYQGVYKLLVDCLKRIGVSPMRSEGKEFDPLIHEAVIREPTDQHPEGTVIEELVRGYLLGDKVLRHAMVKVAVPADGNSGSVEGET